MLDYDISEAPWAEYKDEMEKLVLSGVTYIGAEAFRDFDKLQYIDFGTAIKELGTRSFYGCDGLKELFMPMSFKVFGEESLRACKNLEKIHCDGGFPSFRLNCLWESYVTIYYPAERPWPAGTIGALDARMFSLVLVIHLDLSLSAMFCGPPNSSGSVSAKKPIHLNIVESDTLLAWHHSVTPMSVANRRSILERHSSLVWLLAIGPPPRLGSSGGVSPKASGRSRRWLITAYVSFSGFRKHR
jgi:hypothetical protein